MSRIRKVELFFAVSVVEVHHIPRIVVSTVSTRRLLRFDNELSQAFVTRLCVSVSRALGVFTLVLSLALAAVTTAMRCFGVERFVTFATMFVVHTHI